MAQSSFGPTSGAKKVILIVDDEPDLRDTIAMTIRLKGYDVLTAKNGKEAFQLVEEKHIDMVISDIRMPNGDGIELLDRIKRRNPKTPSVLMITGFTDHPEADLLQRGAQAILYKPFTRSALTAAMKDLGFS